MASQSPFIADPAPLEPRLRRPFSALAFWLLLCFAAASIGSLFPPDTFLQTLDKPFFQPPDWLFAPVWTVLYALMATAMWLVATKLSSPRRERTRARSAFLVQLGLNALWTPLFFGAHEVGLALLLLLVLNVVVIITIRRFYRVDRTAARLMLPYLAWIGFATVLNASLWWLNRGL